MLVVSGSPGPLLCLLRQVAYHSKEMEGVKGTYANPPVSVADDLGSVMDAIRKKFGTM